MEKTENKNALAPKYPFKAGGGSLGASREKSPRINKELGKLSLTQKQSLVLDFISSHIQKLNFPPTVRQIASYFNISAKAAHDHLRAISKKGYVKLFPGSARGIEIVKNTNCEDFDPENSSLASIVQDIQMVPLLGSIAAGTPILAEENMETKLALPKSFLPKTGDMFALRVKGDSMEKAGIFEDDIAVLKQVVNPLTDLKSGDIVAALLDGEATLKTWYKNGKQYELHPENDNYKIIPLDEKSHPSIAGKLVGIYRKYNG